jgi:hypothetical protein
VAVKQGTMGEDMTMVSVTEDRLSMLTRMRARLAQQVDTCGDERSLCLLVTQLRAVLAEIDELSPGDGLSPVDEILRRREERRRKGKPVSASRAEGRAGGGREHG